MEEMLPPSAGTGPAPITEIVHPIQAASGLKTCSMTRGAVSMALEEDSQTGSMQCEPHHTHTW